MWLLDVAGKEEGSRNGPVTTIREPVMFTVLEPQERVLFDPLRDANPFFHVMEFCWMMSGSNNVNWIKQFNKGFVNYAEADGLIHGAYGHRWRKHFNADQLLRVAQLLTDTPTTRRAVVEMWDARCDLQHKNDLPCNTHIYWRIVEGDYLDMTVCNRSNDAVWGMTGANAVHMTLLHEWMAAMVGRKMGSYHVMTNNLHLYLDVHSELLRRTPKYDYYADLKVKPYNAFEGMADALQFLNEVGDFINAGTFDHHWLKNVAYPMREAYIQKKLRTEFIENILAEDWRIACQEWNERRQ